MTQEIDDFNGYLLTMRDKTEMSVNGLKATFHMPEAVARQVNGDGTERVAPLPRGNPRPAFKVDEYPACPASWEHGSAKASSYFVPTVANKGLWLDFNANRQHTHEVAVVVSIQGVNALTGQKTMPIRLEQYRENCPVHNVAFKQDRFCEKCKHNWPAQNYIASTATPHGFLWLDGFLSKDGVVRQWIFTEEEMKGVASQIIGKERVPAIGIAFYLSKNPKPPRPAQILRGGFAGPTLGSKWGSPGVFGMTSGKIGSVNNLSTPDWYGNEESISYTCSVGPAGPSGPSGGVVGAVGAQGFETLASVTPEVEEKTSGGIPLPDADDGSRGISGSPASARRRRRGPGGSSAGSYKRSATGPGSPGYEMNKTFNRQYAVPIPEEKVKKLEVGVGAKIDQTIHADPQSLDYWQEEPAGFIYINYCTLADAAAIIAAGKREEKADGFLDGLKLAN